MDRRWIALTSLAWLGCHKDAAPAPAGGATPPVSAPTSPGSGSGVAAPIDAGVGAPAPAALVELLHAVPTTVRVSSRVANPAIKPAHLVDRDLSTAWNSATGELVGAWIEVTVPELATIAELRMTVGHTGKGPKAEDYFTMNPRIKKVAVWGSGTTAIATFVLDPDRRDLQTLAVKTEERRLRILVEEIVPGSKKAWRETAVSELEVWGTPPRGWTAPASPLSPEIEVGDPMVGTEDSLAALCEAQLVEPLKAHPDSTNYETPTCEPKTFGLKLAKPPWTDAGVTCLQTDRTGIVGHGTFACSIAVATDGRWWTGLEIASPQPPDDAPRNYSYSVEVFETFVVNLPDPMLVVRYRTSETSEPERFTVCRTTPRRGCSEPLATDGGAWKTRPRQVGADLVIEPESGKPPDDELGVVTAQLRFH
ncbi:MAG: hypothetical protein IPQ07_37755 [Myxococcales bacterium]|nr:hypothetical protein [Myxococcales bacterium]